MTNHSKEGKKHEIYARLQSDTNPTQREQNKEHASILEMRVGSSKFSLEEKLRELEKGQGMQKSKDKLEICSTFLKKRTLWPWHHLQYMQNLYLFTRFINGKLQVVLQLIWPWHKASNHHLKEDQQMSNAIQQSTLRCNT